jgi:hypothetical protein
MSLIIRDSFAPYATFADAGQNKWDVAGLAVLTSTTRFGVGQSFVPTTINNLVLAKSSPRNEDTIFFAFSWYYNRAFGVGVGDPPIAIQWLDGLTPQVTAVLSDFDGSMRFYSGGTAGTLLGIYYGAFPAFSWQQFQVEVVISNVAGEIHVRRNGSPTDDFVLTGVNTRGGTSNNYANNFYFRTQNSNNIGYCYTMDMWVWDGNVADTPNTWIGDVKSIWLPPVSDSSVQFTPLSGPSNYLMVNELIEDGDTSYVYSATPGDKDLYGVQAVPTTPTPVSSIVGLTVRGYARKTDSGTRTLAMTMSSAGTPADGPTTNLSTTYQNVELIQDTDPDTSAPWVVADVNALLIGQKVVS